MWRTVGLAIALVALALLAPAEVMGQKKKKNNNDKSGPKAAAADYAALRQVKQLDGKLVTFDGRAKTVTVRVEAAGRKEFELPVVEKVVVRKLNLGVEYDDRGFIKEYTAEQKRALRGSNPSVPGYHAKPEELQPGQDVSAVLGPARKDDKEARPVVRMIVIRK